MEFGIFFFSRAYFYLVRRFVDFVLELVGDRRERGRFVG